MKTVLGPERNVDDEITRMVDGSREDLGSAHVVFHKSNVKAE